MKTKTLLACGLIAGPLFVAAFIMEGATRTGYDQLRHPVSSLALGDSGWAQTTNFIVGGLLTLAFAAGLRRVFRSLEASIWGPLLVQVWAIGLLGAGIFVTDSVSGYPPGTPDQLPQYSWHGALHDLFSLPGLVDLAGLFQRIAVTVGFGWLTLLAVHLLRSPYNTR